ncbi:MAG: hypothetical protein HYS35_08475 [Betaproteobacteria bacterium]|nr:hypothetical protein [Betaproteobacteria bacterium]
MKRLLISAFPAVAAAMPRRRRAGNNDQNGILADTGSAEYSARMRLCNEKFHAARAAVAV